MTTYIADFSQQDFTTIAATEQVLDQYYHENKADLDIESKPTNPAEWEGWYQELLEHIVSFSGMERSFETGAGGTIHIDHNYGDMNFLSLEVKP